MSDEKIKCSLMRQFISQANDANVEKYNLCYAKCIEYSKKEEALMVCFNYCDGNIRTSVVDAEHIEFIKRVYDKNNCGKN